jgi:hypothetical protein
MSKTPLTFVEMLHIQFLARIEANDGTIFPLSQSVPPTPEQIERVRQQFQDAQDQEEADE